mmetsp:Transcript_160047/g.292137  ORF Transcript_160047/g.292137 Transcript_160047/m.292137 type:complete len:436 (+) Transcript_160047:94-1401(+)
MGQVASQLKIVERCSSPSLQRFYPDERKPRNWERAPPTNWEQLDLQAAQYAGSAQYAQQRSYVGYEGLPPAEDFNLAPMESVPVRPKNDGGAAAEEEDPQYEQVMDIPEDCYGATMMTVVKEMAEISDHGVSLINFMRASYVGALMTLNLALQIGFLVSVHLNVVQASVWKVQTLYRGYRAGLFDVDRDFREDIWEDDPLKEEICQIAFTSNMFLYIILLLWTFTMLDEFRQAQTYVLNIQRMPSCEHGHEMLRKEISDAGESISIIALTFPTRAFLHIGVVVPKVSITACLLWLGTRWLSAATSFEDLVMNAVAMEFVCGIDNLLYSVVLPTFLHKEVEDIDFCVLKETEVVPHEQEAREQIVKIIKSLGVVLCVMAFPAFYVAFLQDVLPADVSDVKQHCYHFLAERVPICAFHLLRTSPNTCFPYGEPEPEE